jgi:hypothetical protein
MCDRGAVLTSPVQAVTRTADSDDKEKSTVDQFVGIAVKASMLLRKYPQLSGNPMLSKCVAEKEICNLAPYHAENSSSTIRLGRSQLTPASRLDVSTEERSRSVYVDKKIRWMAWRTER